MIMSADTDDTLELPQPAIDRITAPLVRFLHVEAAGGVVLLLAAVVALILANSPAAAAFARFWEMPLGLTVGGFEFRHSLRHWVNDALMTVFFFVVGLEVKREIVLGELREWRRAALPVAAAIGGIVAPAGIYLLLPRGPPGAHGWGVPIATDIAFVVGCMALLGRGVPHGLRVMVLTLAIADDIGAILVIALVYNHGLDFGWLAAAGGGLALVAGAARLGVRSLAVYGVGGLFVWFCFHESGVHATIAGVILGLMTPARETLSEGLIARIFARALALFTGEGWQTDAHRARHVREFRSVTQQMVSPVEYLIAALHPWVAFAIMPLFALANAGVAVRLPQLGAPVAVAVMAGLVLGKPLGIIAASWVAVRSGFSRLPDGVSWSQWAGGGILCGIGFTMSLFIAGLALDGALLDEAKVGVLVASSLSAAAGMCWLGACRRRATTAAAAGDAPDPA